jgi:hypothetical protein
MAQKDNTKRVGECALCLKQVELCRSHLLPKALYRFVRGSEGEPGSSDPVLIAGGTAVHSSRQFAGHLLCNFCEQLFSSRGEKPTIRVCYRGNGSFPLLDAVLRCPVRHSNPQRTIYDVVELGDLRGQLVYFALSVLWRWSVGHHLWRESSLAPHRLGPYESRLRPYLLGLANVPDGILVLAEAVEPVEDLRWLAGPSGPRKGSPRKYDFWIPGIRFVIQVGGQPQNVLGEHVLSGSMHSTVTVTRPSSSPSVARVARAVASSEARGRLAMDERGEAKVDLI